jgi:hypothetical protein
MSTLYNGILERLILPAGDAALGTKYMAKLNYWREIQYKSSDELQLIQKVGLRKLLIHATKNTYMVVHAFTGIFEHVPEIKQFRVIQKNLDSIDIEYIKDGGFVDIVLNNIRAKIHGYLSEDFPVHFKEVEAIPPTPSGKPQIIQSFLKQSVNE